ncbi:MAG: hypothetical protein ABIR30_12005 [Chitinophagaceae bacterium]
MKRYPIFFLFLLFLSASCKTKDKQIARSENNIDAARNFIRAALDGKFNEARSYMLNDSINTNYMDVAERSYQRADPAVKNGYLNSTIRILNSPLADLNDSTSIIIFSNSFKNDPDTLRVMRIKGEWLVDLKYLYEHDADSLQHKPNIVNDSLK